MRSIVKKINFYQQNMITTNESILGYKDIKILQKKIFSPKFSELAKIFTI